MTVKAIPEGYHALTPGMNVKGADKAIEFYKKVFGAEEKMKMAAPDGTVMHCEMKIGDSIFMIGESIRMEPHAMHCMIYVKDCDATFKKAIDAGATEKAPLADMFWGDRAGRVADAWGNTWYIATHKEDVPQAELEKRAMAMMSGNQPA